MVFALPRLARFGALVVCLMAAAARADEPLHVRIDRHIAAKAQGQLSAPRADDAEFMRRVWLDLAGRIPSAAEARRFLDDPAPDKRAKLIDQLLGAATYPQRMAELFHVLLMERRGDQDDWLKYLQASFEANKPWDQMAREMLNPVAEKEELRGAGFFLVKRLENYGQNPIDYPGLTRDVARLFLGQDLQCAECHNHLFVDDYHQLDFQGLFAVFSNASIRKDVKFPAIAEKPLTKKLEFVSVFDPTKHETGPRLPGGKELTIPPAKSDGPSPLAWLADELPRADNPFFARTAANQFWFVMMGRGMVHPLDLHHRGNPPSHPELLQLLADEFAAHKFDIKWMLRELALSETYQRSGRIAAGQAMPPPETFLVALEKRLSAEQLLWSTLEATGELERVLKMGDEAKGAPTGPSLEELRKGFVAAFANAAREPETEFSATVKGALFTLNDGLLLKLLEKRPGNLLDGLAKLEDPSLIAEELYLSVLSRRPTDVERAEVAEHLAKNHDRRDNALSHLAWAMISSMEFYVNH